jgi:hypothetical protein
MMKNNRPTFIGRQGVLLALAIVLYGLLGPAYCRRDALRPSAEWQGRIDATVLLLQQTDSRAGIVTPEAGIHHFDLNAEVTLTAVPKPGYYFVYWIGDVSDPTANRTIVYLDVPKIVIAVFERSGYEFSLEEKKLQNTLGGGGRLYPSAADYSNQGYTGGGAKRAKEFEPTPTPTPTPTPPEPTPPEPVPDEFPIPEEEPDEFPVPENPEPATLLLLGLGSLLGLRHRGKR